MSFISDLTGNIDWNAGNNAPSSSANQSEGGSRWSDFFGGVTSVVNAYGKSNPQVDTTVKADKSQLMTIGIGALVLIMVMKKM